MLKFKIWVEYNDTIQEINSILHEYSALIPRLELKFNNLDKLEEIIKGGYAKEVSIQSRHGRRIAEPAAIVFNKIRHLFTNYDEIRDRLNKHVQLGDIPICEELEMLESIYSQMKKLVIMIINSINYPFNVYDNVTIRKKDEIARAAMKYFNRESSNIDASRKKYCLQES
jgi:hypothetical protein